MIELERLGWGPDWATEFESHTNDGFEPGRVAIEQRGAYTLYTRDGELPVRVSGRLRHEASQRGELPAVGDWVAHDGATIHAVLPRKTKFSRKVAWAETEEQVVAANVDVVLLATSMNQDLNLRRLERYLTLAWESGAQPAILLTKADLWEDPAAARAEVETIALGVPVLTVSAVTGEGCDEVVALAAGDRTLALLGSSGVGKSTLLNRLVGHEHLKTQEIRADGRGRHTTSHRELVLLPQGGLVIDTPGMRELQLWEGDSGLAASFDDIEELAAGCRFPDCAHGAEPGCTVRAAIEAGTLEPVRLESYKKLQRELEWLDTRKDGRAISESRKARRNFARSLRKSSW